MSVSAATSKAITPPKPDAMQAPAHKPKKSQDYTAARQAPKETRTATKTAFGDVPANDAAEQPIAAPKLAVTDPKSAPDPDKAPSPVDPTVQSILDAKLAGGKTVKEKFDADAAGYLVKAAQQHYDVQKQKGEPLDAASKFFLNVSAKDIAANGYRDDALTVKVEGVFNTDLTNKNLEELYKDPEFAKWATEQQANSIQKSIEDTPDIAKLIAPWKQEGENDVNALRRMQSDYMTSQGFADDVAKAKDGKTLVADALKTLSSLGLGEKEMLGVGNVLTENIRSKYAPDAPKMVIDPATNKAVATEDGYNLATLPDGTHLALGGDGKPVADKQGNPYVYNPDRTAKVDANNAYVQYHAKSNTTFASYGGIKTMLDANGKSMSDAQGRPLAIDNLGGAPIALDKHGKAVADKAGNKLVFDPITGKALADPQSGNAVVIDPKTKAIVQADDGGKIVAGTNGDPYAADQKTGKFVTDPNGQSVQISKDNAAPGIVPGYVVDQNNTKVVVNAANGKPMVNPASGKTVILSPQTNSPELVPLDANGAPKLAEDGKNIVYSKTGNTVVPNTGKGPDWLVNESGTYVQNAAGNYIGVDKQTGLAAPVDEKGFVRNDNGLSALWNPSANAPMTTPGGEQVMIDPRGNLLKANAQGQTIVEEKSGLPFVLDPKTNETVLNPDTGRSILLDKGGALVEYNADDGYRYLINPATRTTVKTPEGSPVVMSDSAGVPYAVTADGTAVKNPVTGNTIVYGTDGQPAKEISTGHFLEITANGKAYVIDPTTNAPMAQKDPKTGAYQVYNADGSALTNPDTGNRIQLVPGTLLKVEIDAATGKPREDGKGHILLVGPDNRPLKTPEGNAVVADDKTGVPVAVDAQGKAITDPASGLPLVIHTDTGKAVTDPETGAAVVIDPASGKPVRIDPKTGKPFKDPSTDLPILANGKTGTPLQGPNGEPVVVAPGLLMPGYVDKSTNTFTAFDFATGKAMTNPKTGAKTILDPDLGIPIEVLPDKAGNLYLVDGIGKVKTDAKGNALLLDPGTGQVVIKDADGKVIDVNTGKKPDKADMQIVAHLLPLVLAPSAANQSGKGKSSDPPPPPPAPANTPEPPDEPGAPEAPPPAKPNPVDDSPPTEPGPSGTSGAASNPDSPFKFKTTPEDREAMKASWNVIKDWGDYVDEPYDYYMTKAREIKRFHPKLETVPDEDLAALIRFTMRSKGINGALRSGDPDAIALYEPSVKGVRSALNHMRELGYGHGGELYRNIAQLGYEIDANWKIGSNIKDPGFISTSIKPDIAEEFGNLRLKLQTDVGVDISVLSRHRWEKEILIIDGMEWNISSGGVYGESQFAHFGDYPGEFRNLVHIMPPNNDAADSPSATTKAPTATDDSTGLVIEIDTTMPQPPADEISIASKSADPPISPSQIAANTSKWTKLGATLGYVLDGLDIVGGAAQVVLGGIQIADGVENGDNYEIASGAFSVLSGGLGVSTGVASMVPVLAAAALPLAAAAFVAGAVVGVIDFVNSLDDDEQFADKLEEMYGPLGLLQDGWRKKAEDAYREAATAHINPNYQA